MSKKDQFDPNFDFEKEYGFDPKTILDPEFENDEMMQTSFDASFDQTFIKDFDEKFDEDFDARFTAAFGEDFTEALKKEAEPEAAQYTEPAFDLAEFDASIIDQSAFESDDTQPSEEEAPAEAEEEIPMVSFDDDDEDEDDDDEDEDDAEEVPQEKVEEPKAPANPRRKPLSRERMIKEVSAVLAAWLRTSSTTVSRVSSMPKTQRARSPVCRWNPSVC